MSLSYHEDGERISIEGEPCPSCSSTATLFDRPFGFWKCEDCSTVWGRDKDDPDYEDAEDIEEGDRQ
jgi:ribosomal protein L37AE/L43A